MLHSATLQSFIEERQAIQAILEHKEHGAGASIMLEAVDRRLETLDEALGRRLETLEQERRNAVKSRFKKKYRG